jgi:hypothetical protein
MFTSHISYRLTLATLLALAVTSTPAISAQDLSQSLAVARPTPCLDVVATLFITEFIANGSHSFLAGIGKRNNFSQKWLPGNALYDHAYAVVFSAFSNDEDFKKKLHNVSAKTYLELQFRRATTQEQEYLSTFFSSKEGSVFWEFMLDGATCQGLFSGITKRKAPLTTEQVAVAEKLTNEFPLKRAGFESAYSKLTAAQKESFDKGYRLASRLSKSEAPDEVAFQESLISESEFKLAAERSVRPAIKQLGQITDEFIHSGN